MGSGSSLTISPSYVACASFDAISLSSIPSARPSAFLVAVRFIAARPPGRSWKRRRESVRLAIWGAPNSPSGRSSTSVTIPLSLIDSMNSRMDNPLPSMR